ncbi:hypothetical protein F5Y02DRAFT_5642 [Annulohypoxylon stygium]|nr:hypothetical protein F5Y02DRAFT_5642 [Annulohypoxylon stygium]
MSQRDPASRSASPRISRSPPAGTSTSPNSHLTDPRRSSNLPASGGPLESSVIPRTNGELTQSLPQRGFGVRNILNPAETQPSPTGTTSSVASGPSSGHPLHPSPNLQGSTYESSPTSSRPPMYQGHGMVTQQTNPATGSQPLGQSPGDRGSPASIQSHHSHHSHHSIGTRRILTPRSPRVSATGNMSSSNAPHHHHYYPGPSSGPNRGYPAEPPTPGQHAQSPRIGGPQPLAPQFGRVHHSGVGPSTTLAPLTTPPPRPLSHPSASSHYSAPGPETQQSQGGPVHQPRPHSFGPIPSYQSAIPGSRGFPSSLPADSRWPGVLGGQGQGPSSVRGMMGMDGHAAMNVGGEPLIVPLDMYNGSKQADEKRQRNAGASARFRARKKDKELQQGMRIQELESQNRELLKRQQEAESDRDRYRSDRDRLRDIVYRTPGISEFAYQGPPSPISTRSGGSFAERSPLGSNPPSLPMPSYGNTDPVTGERAARRRRTDPQLEFGPSYGGPQTSLPSMPQSTHAPLSQPGTPSAMARTSRLPPLRLDQPAGTPTTGPPTSSTPVQNFPPYKREPYETGWATRPGAPHDPSQR